MYNKIDNKISRYFKNFILFYIYLICLPPNFQYKNWTSARVREGECTRPPHGVTPEREEARAAPLNPRQSQGAQTSVAKARHTCGPRGRHRRHARHRAGRPAAAFIPEARRAPGTEIENIGGPGRTEAARKNNAQMLRGERAGERTARPIPALAARPAIAGLIAGLYNCGGPLQLQPGPQSRA